MSNKVKEIYDKFNLKDFGILFDANHNILIATSSKRIDSKTQNLIMALTSEIELNIIGKEIYFDKIQQIADIVGQ